MHQIGLNLEACWWVGDVTPGMIRAAPMQLGLVLGSHIDPRGCRLHSAVSEAMLPVRHKMGGASAPETWPVCTYVAPLPCTGAAPNVSGAPSHSSISCTIGFFLLKEPNFW